MSWGPAGYGLPLPLDPVDQESFDAFVASYDPLLVTDTRPVVNAQEEPAGEVTDYHREDGQVVAKALRHLDPERGAEYWVADPAA